jgi:tetratricopeptide (TPR) repeat protein
LHDLLRTYAAERDQAETSVEDRRLGDARLFDWFAQTAIGAGKVRGECRRIDEIGVPLSGVEPEIFPDYDSADAWCEMEGDAVPTLVRAAVNRGHHDPAARLALQFWTFLLKRGDQDGAIALQRIACNSAQIAGMPEVEATALQQLGSLLSTANQFDEAVDVLHQSIALYTELGSTGGRSRARGSLALARYLQGQHEESLAEFTIALNLNSHAGDTKTRANLLNNVAMTQLSLGLPEKALRLAAKSLEIYRGHPDRAADSFPLDTLAQAYALQGRHDQAIALFTEAVQVALKYHWTSGAVGILIRLGKSYLATGDPVSAARVWQRAASLNDMTAGPRDCPERAELVELLEIVSEVSCSPSQALQWW